MTPTDFYIFPKLKVFTKVCKFIDDEDVVCTNNGCLEEQDQHYSPTIEFELWINVGPSAFQLQEIMLKSDKM